MPKESMTPRERWLAVLNRQKPDRIPMDYWATPEATRKLMRYLKCESEEELFKRLHIDHVIDVHPEYVGPALPKDCDIFGCRYRDVDYGTGVYRECIYHPLSKYKTVEEIKKNYRWPSLDWYDYSVIPKKIIGKEDYPIRGGGSEPFLIYKNLRGQQLLPEMIEAGIDILNPIQWRCKGMDRVSLKRDFGDKVIFHGGMDNQYTLAFGSKEEVRQEVMDNIRILGKGGGYILAPCHNIQAVSPPENIVTMYQTGYEYGWM